MTTIHRFNFGYIAFTKGASESLIYNSDDKESFFSDHADTMSSDGLRTIAFAVKYLDKLPEEISAHTIECSLKLIGLAGLIDPPRDEAKEAIQLCKSAGIKPVIITGDHLLTAKNIALRLDIMDSPVDLAITGSELSMLPADEFDKRVEHIKLYARVSPEQKFLIVKTLQKKGQFVAMTGDGVNDAPSLKKADIGIAMGITGTDVAKEAAHMILMDDNFASIVKAIKEGRRIYDNIRRFIKYALTCNAAEILTILVAPLIGLPIPLLPIHILWINLVTDGLPGIALAAERAEADIMKRAPRQPNENIFSGGLGVHIIWVSMLMATVTIATQYSSLTIHNSHWQSMVFTVLSFSQMGHVLAIRSERQSLFSQGITSNLPMLGAVLLTVALQLAILYLPIGNQIFKTQALSFSELLIAIGLSSVVFIGVEVEKFLKRKFK
jgi:Ca2+-transporting ATPase